METNIITKDNSGNNIRVELNFDENNHEVIVKIFDPIENILKYSFTLPSKSLRSFIRFIDK